MPGGAPLASGMSLPTHYGPGFDEGDFWFSFVMWVCMVVVMMTPLVVPWLRALNRLRPEDGSALDLPSFALGYGVAWGLFSALMAGAQTAIPGLGPHSAVTHSGPVWAGAALLATGAYQWSRLKNACLTHCRSPFGYFAAHWRPGPSGALSMGFRHGLHCLGCCWALMALALVVGMVDLRLMGLLMAIMIAETLAPGGQHVARVAGAAFVLWGLALLLGS